MPLWEDLRFALRHLSRAPLFAATAVLTLALGTGANTGIFSLLNGVLRPLPVPDARRIVVIAATFQSDDTGFRHQMSFPAVLDYRQAANVFTDVFAFQNQLAGLTHRGATTQFIYHVVTGNFFSALGVQPALGRVFAPGEGEYPGSEPIVVLSHATWQNRFGADPSVVGTTVRLNGKAVRVVGVTPTSFHGVQHGIEIDGFVPIGALLRTSQGARLFTDRSIRPFTMMARLAPGVTVAVAQSAVDVIARRLDAHYPADKDVSAQVIPEPLARPIPGRELSRLLRVLYVSLFGLAALVLLITCMNVGNLLLVRATAREREMAIRAALGSSRARLLRPLLIESLLLATAGVLLGLVIARWSNDLMIGTMNLSLDMPLNLDFQFDWRVFTYASVIAVVIGLVMGVTPAVRASKGHLNALLRDGGPGGTAGAARQRVRSSFVVVQIAGSLVLLVVASLAVRNLEAVKWSDPQFDYRNLLTMRVDPAQVGYTRERAAAFFEELDRRLSVLPGVEGASSSFSVPLGMFQFGCGVKSASAEDGSGEKPENMFGCNAVEPDYFDVVGIPVVRGRRFTIHDVRGSEPVVIVNETMARRLWPAEEAVGKRVVFPSQPADLRVRTVVGVARDSKYINVYERPLPYVYMAMAQDTSFMRSIYVRSAVPPEELAARVQRAIHELDPEMPTADVRTMEQTMAGSLGYIVLRLSAVQAVSMGLLGLLLSVVGVYGVVSYAASQRTKEIGIRVALGATRRSIGTLVFGQGVRLVAVGLLVGLVAAALTTTAMSRIFFLVNATDVPTFAAVTVFLSAVVLAACWQPARRATKVDPIVVLRQE